LNNNKLINPKLICAFCWFDLFFNYENARSKKQKNYVHIEVKTPQPGRGEKYADRWSE